MDGYFKQQEHRPWSLNPQTDSVRDTERAEDLLFRASRLRGPEAPRYVPPVQMFVPLRDGAGDYTCAEDLYSAMRLFGNDTYTPAIGDQRHLTAIDSIVTGRADKDTTLRTSSYSLLPSPLNTIHGHHPARALATACSREEFGELPNTRLSLNTGTPCGTMNLTPTNARDQCRQKDVARLNAMNDAYVAARLKSVM